MGGNSSIRLAAFEAMVQKWNCRIAKTTKEWEVIDNADEMRVTGFATIGGRQVKGSWVKRFQKLIRDKRGRYDP